MRKIITGIYAIRNTVNGKLYIGSSKSLHHRWNQSHRPALRKNKHHNKHLQHAWNKYDEAAFEFQIVEECNEPLLVEREEHWIEHHKSWDRQYGYNLNRVIDGRIVMSEETLQKMSYSKKEEWKEIKANNYQGRNLGFIEFKLTQDKQDEIIKLRADGLVWGEIFKITGISRTHFYRAMKIKDGQYGGDTKKRATYRTLTPELLEKVKKLHEKSYNWTAIAEEIGVDRITLYKHGLPKLLGKCKNRSRNKYCRFTPAMIEEAKTLKQSGWTWLAISQKLSVSQTNLRNKLK